MTNLRVGESAKLTVYTKGETVVHNDRDFDGDVTEAERKTASIANPKEGDVYLARKDFTVSLLPEKTVTEFGAVGLDAVSLGNRLYVFFRVNNAVSTKSKVVLTIRTEDDQTVYTETADTGSYVGTGMAAFVSANYASALTEGTRYRYEVTLDGVTYSGRFLYTTADVTTTNPVVRVTVDPETLVKLGMRSFETLSEAVDFARSGNTLTLKGNTDEEVTVDKRLTIVRDKHTASGLKAAEGYVMETTEDEYNFYVESYEIVTEQSSGDCAVTLNYHLNANKSGVAMVAGYDSEGRMTGVASTALAAGPNGSVRLVIHPDGETETVKAFLVSDKLVPLFTSRQAMVP